MEKGFKNGPSKICGRQPLKKLKGHGLPKALHSWSPISDVRQGSEYAYVQCSYKCIEVWINKYVSY